MKKNRDLYGKNQQIADDVHEIKTVLTGADPTGLVPNPPPGVVKSLNDVAISRSLKIQPLPPPL